MNRVSLAIISTLALSLAGCETANKAGSAVKSVGSAVADTAGDLAGGAVSLVNVDLSNVLNDLALDLKIDKANIPINAQIPINLAANICGVSINILSVSTGGSPNCTAKATSEELSQAVQQQMAANGSVGGGSQSTSPATSGTAGTQSPTTSTVTRDGNTGIAPATTSTGSTGTTSPAPVATPTPTPSPTSTPSPTPTATNP